MMLLRSPALAKVLGEFASAEKLAAFEKAQRISLQERLLESAAPVGYLLWHSLKDKLNLRFEELSFGKFLDEKTLLTNLKTFISAVKNHSNRHDLKVDELTVQINSLQNNSHDRWQVCCGHHVIEVLSFALKKTIGTHSSGGATREDLERALRLAFEGTYFKRTRLYRSLLRWQSSHRPFILF